MYQNQPDPAVIAAEKAQKRWWFRKLKLKIERQGGYRSYSCCRYHWRCCAISNLEKKLGSFAYSATLQLRIVLLLLKIN
jgi:YidC/Oxa1 family membrane protein insertase